MNILHFLFVLYCMSLIEVKMLYDKSENYKYYKRMSVTYNKILKQMCGLKL